MIDIQFGRRRNDWPGGELQLFTKVLISFGELGTRQSRIDKQSRPAYEANLRRSVEPAEDVGYYSPFALELMPLYCVTHIC